MVISVLTGDSKDGRIIHILTSFTFSKSYVADSGIPSVTFTPSFNAHHSQESGDQGKSRIPVSGHYHNSKF